MMANTQIDVAGNGTVTLATAGKYCDRNIDVNVDVPGKPTQFANYYDPANVTIKTRMNASAAEGVSYVTDNQCNVIAIPYHHVAGEPVAIRMRGINMVRDRNSMVVFAEDGETRINHYSFTASATSFFDTTYDEYGDVVITFVGNSSHINAEWFYIKFNFQYAFYNASPTAALDDAIITINEPIGNGGYAG